MSLTPRKCCVSSCDQEESSSDCWFYEFPSDELMYETWTKQCCLADTPGPIPIICSSHFDEYSFQSDGELYPDAVPTLNLPEPETPKIDPFHLFVALFIDEAGKIINFSLVEYSTVEKWQSNERFEYGVAEIFTNADKTIDKKLGLLGSYFNCHKCRTPKEFGVVVMQKRDVPEEEEEIVPEMLEEAIEDLQDPKVVEEMPEERLIEADLKPVKRKQQSHLHLQPHKKPRTVISNPPPNPSVASGPPPTDVSKDETIMGIKFFNEKSCNRCGFTPNDEQILLTHVTTCRISQLEPPKNGYLKKPLAKGGQKIRNNYICSKCTISILYKDLQAHAEFHVKFAPYACKCTKCFATEDELTEHSRICGQHLFRCKTCHKEFVKKKDLFQHRSDAHGVNIHGQQLKRVYSK